jgi:hypothetical protein
MTSDERELNRDLFPWQFKVKDRFGRTQPMGYGVQNGAVLYAGPDYWTADPDTRDQIKFGYLAACEVAEKQRRS